jgi:UDP-N-acetylglucosamine--N-acetylmuramyl-(pentapeptide) pyrophosphoryl-undecaprenol N-acetylglucosamine transferase
MTMASHLCIAGGGTGGHVMPALALADAARKTWPELKVTFIGAERGLEARLLPERGEEVLLLTMHSVQGASLIQKIRVLLWELPKAVFAVRKHWKNSRPSLVVGVGGYASVTGVIAALISRIPVVLYEQNAVPGLVNRKLVRFCKAIMLGFSEASRWLPESKSVVTGNIVRDAIAAVSWQSHTPPRLLVLGGSQGASFLNETVPAACRELTERGRSFTVTHIAGANETSIQKVRNAYREVGIEAEVLGFCDDMPTFYGSGDLMIARSGAMTVGEAATAGMPSIFVPLPHAADHHQFYNARAMADQGAAMIFEQSSCSASALTKQIGRMLFDNGKLTEMSSAAKAFAPVDAAAKQLAALKPYLPGLTDLPSLSEVNA